MRFFTLPENEFLFNFLKGGCEDYYNDDFALAYAPDADYIIVTDHEQLIELITDEYHAQEIDDKVLDFHSLTQRSVIGNKNLVKPPFSDIT